MRSANRDDSENVARHSSRVMPEGPSGAGDTPAPVARGASRRPSINAPASRKANEMPPKNGADSQEIASPTYCVRESVTT